MSNTDMLTNLILYAGIALMLSGPTFFMYQLYRKKRSILYLLGNSKSRIKLTKQQGTTKANDQYVTVKNSYTIYGSIIGAAIIFLLEPTNIQGLMIGGTMGSIIGYILSYMVIKHTKHQIMREITIFYDVLELYIKKYHFYDAMTYSSQLLPGIRPHIDKCLYNWSVEGFKQLAKDLGNTDEAKMLCSILIQIFLKGENVGEVLNEGKKLDDIRASLAELEMESKPIYQALNLSLPALGFFSLVVMPWVYKIGELIGSVNVNSGQEMMQKVPFINNLIK